MANKRGKRNKMIGVWCTKKEYNEIKDLAELAGVSKGRLCRMLALGEISQEGELIGRDNRLKELLTEFTNIGTNINQIAKVANETAIINVKRIENVSEELAELKIQVLEELQ